MTAPRTLFVWEAITAGACGTQPPDSLRIEGRAMWLALVEDLLRIEGMHVVSLWHNSAGPIPVASTRLLVEQPSTGDVSDPQFDRFGSLSDLSWIIAPELDGLLVDRLHRMEHVGGRFVGPNILAAELCADKLALFHHLQRHGIATPQTEEVTASTPAPGSPVVVKLRDGAGSLGCRVIRTSTQWEIWRLERADVSDHSRYLVQPLIAGAPLSVAAIVPPEDGPAEFFPVGRQVLSQDDRLQYRGGEIPYAVNDDVHRLVKRTIESISGLSGYIGFDLILPDDGSPAILVEINPRLTTAYLGYRALTADNLAERIISPERFSRPVIWRPGPVFFDSDGAVA